MLFLFLSVIALAGDLRFTPYAQLPAASRASTYRAAVHLLESANGRCTATEISSTGHLLTARHCLQKCLIASGVFQWKKEQGAVDYFVLDRQKLGKASCRVLLDGVEEELVVEATSPGLVTYMDQASLRSLNPARFREMYEDGYTDLGDFAVVRRPVPGACVPLSDEPPTGRVSSLGYPSETSRPDGFNSDGNQLYFTRGEVLAGVGENACFGELTAAQQERARKDYDHRGAFMSSLDAIHGSSGSSVLNESGEVVGVFTKMFIHPGREPDKIYCRGSATALSVGHIRRMFHGLTLECAGAARE